MGMGKTSVIDKESRRDDVLVVTDDQVDKRFLEVRIHIPIIHAN